jgi:hypothetical protein
VTETDLLELRKIRCTYVSSDDKGIEETLHVNIASSACNHVSSSTVPEARSSVVVWRAMLQAGRSRG